jgi:hypothetical protein
MAALLCEGLLSNPKAYDTELRLLTGRVIMKIVYGVFVQSSDDSVSHPFTRIAWLSYESLMCSISSMQRILWE